MEVTLHENEKEDFVQLLKDQDIKILQNFDPMSYENFRGIISLKPVNEKIEYAKTLYKKRITKAIERLPNLAFNDNLKDYLQNKLAMMTQEYSMADLPTTSTSSTEKDQDPETSIHEDTDVDDRFFQDYKYEGSWAALNPEEQYMELVNNKNDQ